MKEKQANELERVLVESTYLMKRKKKRLKNDQSSDRYIKRFKISAIGVPKAGERKRRAKNI